MHISRISNFKNKLNKQRKKASYQLKKYEIYFIPLYINYTCIRVFVHTQLELFSFCVQLCQDHIFKVSHSFHSVAFTFGSAHSIAVFEPCIKSTNICHMIITCNAYTYLQIIFLFSFSTKSSGKISFKRLTVFLACA